MKNKIAFDFGHGETAAAYANKIIQDGKMAYEVKRLVFGNSRATVYSRIFITEEQMQKLSAMEQIDYNRMSELGDFIIGNFSKQTRVPGETFSYFKVQPSRFDDRIIEGEYSQKYKITYRMVMSCFVYQCVKDVLSNNPNDLMDYKNSKTTLIVGCPTTKEWTSTDNTEAYKNLLINATGVKNVIIIPESRAAMFSSITYNMEAVAADKGAVIFDFGSSTADCTYMWMGKKQWEFSWRLGASEIERALYNYFVKEHNDQEPDGRQITTEQNILSSVECTRLLREGKEEYYSTENDIEKSLIFEKTSDRPKLAIITDINDESTEAVMHKSLVSFKDSENRIKEGTWYDLCKAFFETAKEEISASRTADGELCSISSIVLTGGASKMPFVEELCREVFPDATIYLESNPSYSVSNGLCWAQISEENLDACRERILKKAQDNPVCKVDYLLHMTSEALFEPLIEIISNQAKIWSQREENSSIEALINIISNEVTTDEVKNRFKAIVSNQEQEWKKQCSNVMMCAIKEEAESLYSTNVPDYVTKFADKAFGEVQLNFEEVINSLCAGFVKSIQDIIVQIIIWIIAFALMATGWGIPIGLALLGYSERIAENMSVINREITRNLNKFFRERVSKHISSITEKNNNDLIEKIYSSLKADFEKSGLFNEEQLQEKISLVVENSLEIMLLKKFD